ncbi:MAG: hypothetical protein JSW06_08490 [Thermoplasmatales archaeon]|nr:MAG: hypothetical protein JSW06_08490 [Thermoplasmatales archaeon]
MKKDDNAISQIMGACLLLLIALACFSMIYMYVFTYPMPNPAPYVEIVGSIEGGNIVLLHFGGENLKLDTQLIMNKGNTTEFTTVENYLDSKSKNNSFWNIGERLLYPIGDVTGLKVAVSVIDKDTSSVIFHGWLKDTFSDTYNFSKGIGKQYDIIRIPNTLNVIMAYTDKDNDGFVLTLELASDGDITTILDSLEFDPNFCMYPKLIHVSGSIYAICYRGQGSAGTIKTVQIASNGSINDTVYDTQVFDFVQCLEPDIIHVSGNVYAISYRGDNDDGFLKTIGILSDGDITAVIDILEFDASMAIASDIIHISGDIYAIAYSGEDDDGFLKTVEIATNGAITNLVIDTLEFDPLAGKNPVIALVDGDIHAIAYTGENSHGYLKTIEIDGNGTINNAVIDTTKFDSNKGEEPDIIHISGNIFALAYSAAGDVGNIITVEIANDGSIIDPIIDAFEFSAFCRNPHIIHVSENMYGVAYLGAGNNGFMTTVFINSNGNIY